MNGKSPTNPPTRPTRPPHVTVPSAGGQIIYDTTFSASPSSSPYVLRITLPGSFPSEPPIITLLEPSPSVHPILNRDMECVNLSSLRNWGRGDNGVTLLKVVEEVASSLVSRSPVVNYASSAQYNHAPPSYDNAMGASASASAGASASASGGAGTTRNRRSLDRQDSSDGNFHMPLPPVPSSFPDLESMPQSSLQRLLNDDVALSIYVSNLPAVKTMEELQQSIFEGNYQSAKNNLSQEEEMGSLHAEVEVLKSQLIEKINKFHEIRDSQASLLSGMSPTELYETLKSGADESLAKSDAISDDFLSGKIGIDKFVEDYSKVRQEYHGRMAKLEKIDRQKRMY